MLLKLLRNTVGSLFVFANWVTQPKPIERSETEQRTIQDNFKGHSLYQLFACPFCVKTRRALHRLNIDMEIKDINKDSSYREELEKGGGKIQVPSLRIEENGQTNWLYESGDIINYLENRVSNSMSS